MKTVPGLMELKNKEKINILNSEHFKFMKTVLGPMELGKRQ